MAQADPQDRFHLDIEKFPGVNAFRIFLTEEEKNDLRNAVANRDRNEIFESAQKLVLIAINSFTPPVVNFIIQAVVFIGKLLGCMNSFETQTCDNQYLQEHWFEKITEISQDMSSFCYLYHSRKGTLDQSRRSSSFKKVDAWNLFKEYKEMGLDVLGTLHANINLKKSNRDFESLKQVGRLLKLYTQVTFVRLSVMLQIISIFREAQNDNLSDQDISEFMNQMIESFEDDVKEKIEFVTGVLEPTHANATFLSYFEITDFPEVKRLLSANEEKAQLCLQEHSQHLENKIVAFRPIAFPMYWMNVSSYFGFVWSKLNTYLLLEKDYAQFIFVTNEYLKKNNLFFIQVFKKTGKQPYLYMKQKTFLGTSGSFLSTMDSEPNDEGLFKVIHLRNGCCLLSVRKWPGKFIYMERYPLGRIKGGESSKTYGEDGLPNLQHEWCLEEVCHNGTPGNVTLVQKPKFKNVFPSDRN